MSPLRNLSLCLAIACLAAAWSQPAHAQIRAMPLNTARAFPKRKPAPVVYAPQVELPAVTESVDPTPAAVAPAQVADATPIPDTTAEPDATSDDGVRQAVYFEETGPVVVPATWQDGAAYGVLPQQVLPQEPLALNNLPGDTAPYGNAEPSFAAVSGLDGGTAWQPALTYGPAAMTDSYTWQILPEGLMYRSYLAGNREPRFASQWIRERDHGWLWDITLGGRAGILRYGTRDAVWPQGFQADIEGAAFPRLDLEHDRDMAATDFRFGVPLTFRRGIWEGKFSYYHLSSHLGDELIVRTGRPRINYVRDALVLGLALWLFPDMRLYSEADWAMQSDGGSDPWAFQFGIDWSSPEPTGPFGSPFFAVNGSLRQELDFGGGFTVENGWQWRGEDGQLVRVGMHYFNGQSEQRQFFTEHEEQIGIGLWYDY